MVMMMLAKPLVRIALAFAICALVTGLLALSQCRRAATAATEVRLATGQAGATLASGRDAVGTLGNVMAGEAAIDRVTEENGNAIDSAPGADARVSDSVRAAGLRSLCRRASYRADHAECVH